MPPLARTNEEAHLYMDLHPCACGGDDAARDSSVGVEDGAWVSRYTCVCRRCGRQRVFQFRQPEAPGRPAEGAWSTGPEPSELLDAGDWLWVADLFGGAPAEPAGLSPAEVGRARADLAAAGGAVDEVLKFLPAGADEVPEAAFWTERGRRLRASAPDRFRRERLAAVRDTYRTLQAELAR
jgi:hypothetical protein